MWKADWLRGWLWAAAAAVASVAMAAVPEPPMPGAPQQEGFEAPQPMGQSPAVAPSPVERLPSVPPMPPSAPLVPAPATADWSAPFAQPAAPQACPGDPGSGMCGHHGCRDVDCSEMPLGDAMRAHLNAQICNGWKAQMVLYHYDFCQSRECDAFKLNLQGTTRLKEIVRLLPCTQFHPILIESTPGDPALDAARRSHVLAMVRQMNVPIPDALVTVGTPATRALRGEEAVEIHRNLMEQVKKGADPLPSSSSSGSMSNGANGSSVGSGISTP